MVKNDIYFTFKSELSHFTRYNAAKLHYQFYFYSDIYFEIKN